METTSSEKQVSKTNKLSRRERELVKQAQGEPNLETLWEVGTSFEATGEIT